VFYVGFDRCGVQVESCWRKHVLIPPKGLEPIRRERRVSRGIFGCCGAPGRLAGSGRRGRRSPACTHGAAAGETIYLAGDYLAFIVLLKDHFIRRSLISTEQKTRITWGASNHGDEEHYGNFWWAK
jgi:hypothetical protein